MLPLERFKFPHRWNWHSCEFSLATHFEHHNNTSAGGVPSPLDEVAELASAALKEQTRRDKEQMMDSQKKEKEAAKAAALVSTQVAVPFDSKPRFSGMANSDADRALRLAAVEARMGIVRCVQCCHVISGPGFHQMGFCYCSTACIAIHRKNSSAPS
jgi:hypothetical protein